MRHFKWAITVGTTLALIEELFLWGMKMHLWPEGPGGGMWNFLNVDDKPFGFTGALLHLDFQKEKYILVVVEEQKFYSFLSSSYPSALNHAQAPRGELLMLLLLGIFLWLFKWVYWCSSSCQDQEKHRQALSKSFTYRALKVLLQSLREQWEELDAALAVRAQL